MLFHEALHLVFTTFSRQVLQQGRLTAYLADCGVFDVFDDRRTICQTIDRRYGNRLYACLSHQPYKATFDAMIAEVKALHPTIDPAQVDYVFQSIRFAWGKLKSVRPPKAPILFAPQKKKRSSRLSPIAHRLSPIANHQSPKKRPSPKKRQTPIANRPLPIANHQSPKKHPTLKLTPVQRKKRAARMVLYFLALIFLFCSTMMYNAKHDLLGTIFLAAAAISGYVIYKYLK